MVYPKARFSSRLPNGDYLTLAVWPGKRDPTAEVLTIQIRRLEADSWRTIGRLAVYRSSDGNYSQLPERQPLTEAEDSQEEFLSE
ncbi:MAG: hypothetical protein QW238_05620 [Candidatus Bathyarchaeia archaeon]